MRERETKTQTIRIMPRNGNRRFLVRTRKVRNLYQVDTKKTIERAIENLEELAEEAHKRATSKYLSTDTRQKWARIEAYIYQTVNNLTKTYDSQRIMEKMDELTRRVEELMEEDQGPGEEDRRTD